MQMTRAHAFAVALGFGVIAAADPASQIGERELHETMQAGAEEMQSMPMTGDLEHDFMWALRKQDQSTIDMARVVLKRSKDEGVRRFAQKAIDRQTREVTEVDQWMGQHHRPMK